MSQCSLTFSSYLAAADLPECGITKGSIFWASDQVINGSRIPATPFISDGSANGTARGAAYLQYECSETPGAFTDVCQAGANGLAQIAHELSFPGKPCMLTPCIPLTSPMPYAAKVADGCIFRKDILPGAECGDVSAFAQASVRCVSGEVLVQYEMSATLDGNILFAADHGVQTVVPCDDMSELFPLELAGTVARCSDEFVEVVVTLSVI